MALNYILVWVPLNFLHMSSSFTDMNSQGSRVEKNTHAQKVQMQKILFT